MSKKDLKPDDQMIEAVVQDYLQRNPGMKRENLLVQTVGGKLVVRSIKKAFSSVSKSVLEKQTASPQYPRFLEEISRSSAERYESCRQSLQSTKQYADWISLPRFSTFSDGGHRKILESLKRLEQKFAQLHDALQDVKDRFSETINGGIKPDSDVIRAWVREYMEVLLDQLKCQRSILKVELKLGDQFAECAKRFLSEGIPKEYNETDPDFIKVLVKAVRILKNHGIDVPVLSGSMDVKTFGAALNQFANQLEERRKQLGELHQLIAQIETFIKQLQGNSPDSTVSTHTMKENKLSQPVTVRSQNRKK